MPPKKYKHVKLTHDIEEAENIEYLSAAAAPLITPTKRKRGPKTKKIDLVKESAVKKVYRKRPLAFITKKRNVFPHESESVEFVSITLPKSKRVSRLNSTKKVQTDFDSDENLENVIKKKKFIETVHTEIIPIDTINEDASCENKIVALDFITYNTIDDANIKKIDMPPEKEENMDLIENNESSSTSAGSSDQINANSIISQNPSPSVDNVQENAKDASDDMNSDCSINENQIANVADTIPSDYDKFMRNIENSHLVSVFGNTIKSTFFSEYNPYTFSWQTDESNNNDINKNLNERLIISVSTDIKNTVDDTNDNDDDDDELMDSQTTLNFALPDIDANYGAGDNTQNQTLDSDDE